MPRRLAKQCLFLLTGDGDDGVGGFSSTNDRRLNKLLTLRRLRPEHK